MSAVSMPLVQYLDGIVTEEGSCCADLNLALLAGWGSVTTKGHGVTRMLWPG